MKSNNVWADGTLRNYYSIYLPNTKTTLTWFYLINNNMGEDPKHRVL